MDANAAEDAEAYAEGTAPRKHQHSSEVVSDPDQVIAGELADDESNKRTGPKSKRKHQLGMRRAAGGGHADKGASPGNQDMLLCPNTDGDGAATRIQSVYRGHQGRNMYFFLLGNEVFASEAQRHDNASAALVIQCAFRCFQARNQYYDLLGTGDGCTRAPSYESSVVPDAIFEKYLRVMEGNVFCVEQALREATGKAKADGRATGGAGDDRRLEVLLEENSQLHAKLAEANDFLKSMSSMSPLETKTLKIQLEMKDEEIEEMQEELKDKLEELARVKEELQRFQSSRTQAEEFGQGLNAPLGAAQETCEGLEETLGTLIGAVSAALNSRHQTHMEVGNLHALANSLQEMNDTLMYENQHLRTKAAGLGKDQEDKLAASEAEVQELTATLASLKAGKDALVEQLHDTNGELTARCHEVDRLQEELNESQHNLLATQKCADELRARSDACNDELLSLNERMKQMQEAGQTLESGKAAADLATKTLTGQLDAERQRVALLEEESTHLQVKFSKAQESFAAKEKELDALRCEREGQDAIEDFIGGLLRYMETHVVRIAALETQLRLRENAQHMIAKEHAQGLAQALDTAAAAAASLAALEKQQQQQQAQLASAKQQATQALEAATAHTSLATTLSEQVDTLTANISTLRSALADAKAAHEKETAQLMVTLAEEKSTCEELRAEFTIVSSSVDGAQQLQEALERVQLEKGKADAENRDLYQRMKALEAEMAAAENSEETKRLKGLIDTMQAEKDAMLEEMMAANSQATNIITGLDEAELLQCRTLKSLKYSLRNLIGVHDAQARMLEKLKSRRRPLVLLPLIHYCCSFYCCFCCFCCQLTRSERRCSSADNCKRL
jgi:DNA repair exonuclease SbcCD ATPase subunit